MKSDFLIVGAGFAGSTLARCLADAGRNILLIERRQHVGGNAYDKVDLQGVLVHVYGPHIFHTNAPRIVEFLGRFTRWRLYEHRVRACVDGTLYPFPINLDTLNALYGLALDEHGAQEYLNRVREPRQPLLSSQDVVVDRVGWDLYQRFFAGYTRKQWGIDAAQLSAGVTSRIPVRTNRDDRYFTDSFQGVPLQGYSALFENMLDHPRIHVELGTDHAVARQQISAAHTVYTGPVDSYFDYCYGRLPYRSLHFEHQHISEVTQFQPVGTVNYPNEHDYTRITEFKHLTGQDHPGTSIVREYPRAEGEPYYPIPTATNEAQYQRYKALADQESGVTFVGRLAQYRYYNMDQVVAAALTLADRLLA